LECPEEPVKYTVLLKNGVPLYVLQRIRIF